MPIRGAIESQRRLRRLIHLAGLLITPVSKYLYSSTIKILYGISPSNGQENRTRSVLLTRDRDSLEAIIEPAIVYEIENPFVFPGAPRSGIKWRTG